MVSPVYYPFEFENSQVRGCIGLLNNTKESNKNEGEMQATQRKSKFKRSSNIISRFFDGPSSTL